MQFCRHMSVTNIEIKLINNDKILTNYLIFALKQRYFFNKKKKKKISKTIDR